MSGYSYEKVERKTRTVTGGKSFGYQGRRSTFGYWVPLALTVTAATVGLVAWIWSERSDDEEISEDEQYQGGRPPSDYANMSGGLPPGPGPSGFQGQPPGADFGPPSQGGFQAPMGGPPPPGGFQGPSMGGPGPEGPFPPGQGPFSQGQGPPQGAGASQEYFSGARSTAVGFEEDNTMLGTVNRAMKRAPSPGQSYDWASTKLAAGVAAAGALMGGALGSIRENSQDNYEDHDRWSEEAENRDVRSEPKRGIKRQGTADQFFSGEVAMPKSATVKQRQRKSVALVVSAVEHEADSETDVGHHASILSHLPDHMDLHNTRIFVLIYAPELKVHHLSPVATGRASGASMASSFSNISQGDLHTPGATPGEFPNNPLDNVDPNPIDETSSLYKTLHNQASALVERDTMIMPFTSRQGHVHMLKSLAPETVYIQESLCGENGSIVSNLSGWVKQTVVVIGDEGGHGGLVDTDDDMAASHSRGEMWWQQEERTGLGKRVAVVESLKVGDDWRRRVAEQD